LNIGLAKDLVRLGGQVCLVGPGLEALENSGLRHWPVPALNEPYYPILEIFPLQFAAYQAAAWRGFHPGQMLVAGLVTAEETGFPGLKEE
jgi:hypothetical protein